MHLLCLENQNKKMVLFHHNDALLQPDFQMYYNRFPYYVLFVIYARDDD